MQKLRIHHGSPVKNLPAIQHGFNPWVSKILWRRKRQPTPIFLPGKSHGQRSLASCSQWVSGASKRNPARYKVWVQGAGMQRRPDRSTIHSQASALSSSDPWRSMFPKNQSDSYLKSLLETFAWQQHSPWGHMGPNKQAYLSHKQKQIESITRLRRFLRV